MHRVRRPPRSRRTKSLPGYPHCAWGVVGARARAFGTPSAEQDRPDIGRATCPTGGEMSLGRLAKDRDGLQPDGRPRKTSLTTRQLNPKFLGWLDKTLQRLLERAGLKWSCGDIVG